jgi:hypothetical protein
MGTDHVDDTPNQAGANTGRPVFPHVTCGNGPHGDMFVNFMDYTDDAGMVMFTHGQAARIQAALTGPRALVLLQATEGADTLPPADWLHTDVTATSGAPEAAGDPVVVTSADGVLVLYRGVDGHIHELRSSPGGPGFVALPERGSPDLGEGL